MTADDLARFCTSFDSFHALLNAYGGYSPSLNVSYEHNLKLADLYDNAQLNRGDPRRAFRYQ